MAGCGLTFLNPWNHPYAMLPAYAGFASIAPEWFWGCLFFIHGTGQAWAANCEDIHVRRRASFVSAGLWLFISLAFTQSSMGRASMGMALFPGLCFISAWAYMRLGSEARWRT